MYGRIYPGKGIYPDFESVEKHKVMNVFIGYFYNGSFNNVCVELFPCVNLITENF